MTDSLRANLQVGRRLRLVHIRQAVDGAGGRPKVPGVHAREPAARAENRRFWLLSALRAHTKTPYKTDLHRKDAKGA